MRHLPILACLTLALATTALPPTATNAQAATAKTADITAPAARDFIQGLAQQAIGTLTDLKVPEPDRVRRFRSLLLTNFDVPTIARFTLGRYWRVATPAQQQEFQKLFEEMLIAMYKERLNDYRGQQLRTQTAAVDNSGRYVMVQSLVFDPAKNQNVAVEWRVSRTPPRPRIVDVMVEGMSMGLTQRAEFASVIERNGGQIEGLLTEMRRKYASNNVVPAKAVR